VTREAPVGAEVAGAPVGTRGVVGGVGFGGGGPQAKPTTMTKAPIDPIAAAYPRFPATLGIPTLMLRSIVYFSCLFELDASVTSTNAVANLPPARPDPR
jgi:hypothetical protein